VGSNQKRVPHALSQCAGDNVGDIAVFTHGSARKKSLGACCIGSGDCIAADIAKLPELLKRAAVFVARTGRDVQGEQRQYRDQ